MPLDRDAMAAKMRDLDTIRDREAAANARRFGPPSGPGLSPPPPPGLAADILAAEQAGDWPAARRLKIQLLRQRQTERDARRGI